VAASAHRKIKLIATDVDGTLLDSQQNLHPSVEAAVTSAARAGVPVSCASPGALASTALCCHPQAARTKRNPGPPTACTPPALLLPFAHLLPLQLLVATGKARGPWAREVLPKLPRMPGVFLQVGAETPRPASHPFRARQEPVCCALCGRAAAPTPAPSPRPTGWPAALPCRAVALRRLGKRGACPPGLLAAGPDGVRRRWPGAVQQVPG
jgi:hypothetical protein